jgi:hypothetical protein
MKNKNLFVFGIALVLFALVVGVAFANPNYVRPGLYKADNSSPYYYIESSTRTNARKVQKISSSGKHIAWGTAIISGYKISVSFDNIDNETWDVHGSSASTAFFAGGREYKRVSD